MGEDRVNDRRRLLQLFSLALRLYPNSYRERYERDMLMTVSDMLDEASSPLVRGMIWLHVLADQPTNIMKQQVIVARSGEGFGDVPPFIKKSGLTSAVLLLPFFGALIANGLDKVLFNQSLNQTWVWQRPFIGLWILYFPLIALLLVIGSYIRYVIRGSGKNGHSALRRIFDLPHFWPLVGTGVIATGILFIIFFHDSVACWVRSPSYLAAHISQSWQCTQTNRVGVYEILKHSLIR
jgi:hypothetical protein